RSDDDLLHDRPMTIFYTIDDANARLSDVRPILELLRGQRTELVDLRDRLLAVAAGDPGGSAREDDSDEARLIRLKIRALVDQMGASVTRLDEWGVTLRDIETGLIDFPALVSGRQVCLCWRLGEGPIEWWHELEAGFGGRQRLIDLA
ncbi:MAG TPA: DUF2203 domain-containing protein, partial [Candidatus Limnocylindrales bacterium]